jgi:hypothetical protein
MSKNYKYIFNELSGVNEIALISSWYDLYNCDAAQSSNKEIYEQMFKHVQDVLRHRRICVKIFTCDIHPSSAQGIKSEDSALRWKTWRELGEDRDRPTRTNRHYNGSMNV